MYRSYIVAADYDVKRAETGIVYIDEIDKTARKGENRSITRAAVLGEKEPVIIRGKESRIA